MMCYPPSGYIIFNLNYIKGLGVGGWGLGSGYEDSRPGVGQPKYPSKYVSVFDHTIHHLYLDKIGFLNQKMKSKVISSLNANESPYDYKI